MSRAYILMIEDNPADALLVEEALKNSSIDYELRVIGDGGDALRFIQQLDTDSTSPVPRLVIVDLNLPKHDGGEILERLRSCKRCAAASIIVMSSSDSDTDREKAARHSAVYFCKPSSLDAFMQIGRIARHALDNQDATSIARL